MDPDANISKSQISRWFPDTLPWSIPANTTSVTHVRVFVDALESMGVVYTRVLERCGIDPSALDDPEQRLPESKVALLWPTAANLTEDPHLGLHAGQLARPHASNVVVFLLMSSPTVGAGLERLVRYHRLVIGQEWIEVKPDRSQTRVMIFPQAQWAWERHRVEMLGMLLTTYLNWISAEEIHPLEVRFRHLETEPLDEYDRAFQCPVQFGAEQTCLVFDASCLEQPSVHSNPDLLKVHERYASNRLRQLHAGGVAGRVQGLLASMLEHGPIALHELARRLHMSPRTLQRRLAEESTSYNTILDAMRQEVALDELERGDTPLAEIAYMTGFANPSAFYRAVHRWTGKTPLACRRDHLHR